MYKKLTRTALLLALVLMFQSLRFFIPVPPLFSTLFIGSLVNASLFLVSETLGLWSAVLISVAAPIVAYFQQLLPLPVFIFPVALGNIVLVILFRMGLRLGKTVGIGLAAAGKTSVLYGSFTYLFTFINLPTKIAAGIMLAMSWPQLVTGIIGGVLAVIIGRKLKMIL